jgi:hypothetical protein
MPSVGALGQALDPAPTEPERKPATQVISDKYRVYPTRAQQAALAEMLANFCDIYNAGLAERINAYRSVANAQNEVVWGTRQDVSRLLRPRQTRGKAGLPTVPGQVSVSSGRVLRR